MNRKYRAVLISWIAVIALISTACGGSSSSSSSGDAAPKAGGTITVGLEQNWNSMDPLKANSFNSHSVMMAIYDRLFILNPKGKLEPTLATGYTASDDSKTYTVKLRTGIKFQDGTDFNAEAVKINLDRMRDPANGCTCLGNLEDIADVAVQDAQTVVITLSTPNAAFPVEVLADAPGMIVSPAALQKYGTDIANNPVGAGPFKFESQVSGSSVTLKKWDGYYKKGRPYLDGVTFKIINDSDARYASVQSGSVQVAENVFDNYITEAKNDSTLRVDDLGGLGANFIAFQTQSPALKDPEVRRAACMAIDPKAINEALYSGGRRTGIQTPYPAYEKKADGYPSFDPKKAKAAVSKLGGISFELTINNSAENQKLAQALQAQWKAVGINVDIKIVDGPTSIQNSYKHDFQALLYRWQGLFDPDGNAYVFFHSKYATPDKLSRNYTLTNNPDIDKYLDEARQSADPDKRKAAYKSLSSALAQEMPYCYLWTANWYRVTKANVHGLPKTPNSIDVLTDVYVS